jgi:hypothetical protein
MGTIGEIQLLLPLPAKSLIKGAYIRLNQLHTLPKKSNLMAFVSKSVSMTIQLIFHMILLILLTFIETTPGSCNHRSFPYRDIAATIPNSPHRFGTQSD